MMVIRNYNLCYLVIIFFTSNIRSDENDLYHHVQTNNLRKFKSHNTIL